MSDWRSELERVKSTFLKGIAALEILVSRANSDIETTRKKVDHNVDRLTKLEAAIPDSLREKITRFDIYIDQLEETRREHTGQIRIIRENELKDETGVKKAEIKSTEKTESKKMIMAVVVAVVGAVGSLIIQLVQFFLKG
jgi:hypothetical protein